MNKLNRRGFLQLAGAASAAVPVAAALDLAAPGARNLAGPSGSDVYRFRAVAELPQQPLPPYASYVVTRHVDWPTRNRNRGANPYSRARLKP